MKTRMLNKIIITFVIYLNVANLFTYIYYNKLYVDAMAQNFV